MAALPTTDDPNRVTPGAAGTADGTDGSAAGATDSDGGRRRWWPRRATLRSLAPEIAVAAAALALNLWNLSVNGYGNTYYAAAVRSMSESWHNFFYASVDPGGWITVDKPPLALWVQAFSIRLFGYSSWSMFVPGALAGAAAVALVMWMVRRTWGRAPGLIAGLVLATTPVAVAVARSNNPDGMLLLLVTAAAAALLHAVESGRLAWLLGAAGLVAAAFLTKLLAALIVLPALWLAYLLFARRPWRVPRRAPRGCDRAAGRALRRLGARRGPHLAVVAAVGRWLDRRQRRRPGPRLQRHRPRHRRRGGDWWGLPRRRRRLSRWGWRRVPGRRDRPVRRRARHRPAVQRRHGRPGHVARPRRRGGSDRRALGDAAPA